MLLNLQKRIIRSIIFLASIIFGLLGSSTWIVLAAVPANASSIVSIAADTHINSDYVDTEISGIVTSGEWSGVITMTGDVVISAGEVVTITPKTEVRALTTSDYHAADGVDTRVELIVLGELVIDGTASQPITLTSAAAIPDDADWYGVRFLSGSDGLIEHGTIKYGVRGVSMFNNTELTIRSSTIRDNYNRVTSGSVYAAGLYASGNFTLTVEDSTFFRNRSHVASPSSESIYGGNIYLNGGSTIIRNSQILTPTNAIWSYAGSAFGGGIYATGSGDLLIEGSRIHGNKIHGDRNSAGGGLYLDNTQTIISDTLITNNDVTDEMSIGTAKGGGLYIGAGTSVTITASTIEQNIVKQHRFDNAMYAQGGGIYSAGDLALFGSTLSENLIRPGGSNVDGRGAGIYIAGGTADIERTVIHGNRIDETSLPGYGGGIYVAFGQVDVVNSLIVSNQLISTTSNSFGGGVYVNGGTVDLVNNTIADNQTNSNGGGVFFNGNGGITNTIVVSNSAGNIGGGIYRVSGGVSIDYNDVWNNSGGNYYPAAITGTNDISADPLFVNGFDGYHIDPNSLCVDSGTNTGAPEHDFDGEPRPIYNGFDIGFDETIGFPLAFDDQFMVLEDSLDNQLDVLDNDVDMAYGPLLISMVGAPDQGGTLISGASAITYTPMADFFGQETFTYSISDGVFTDTAVVTITLVNVNDPPVLVPIGDQWIAEGDLLTLTVSASDIDPNDSLIFSLDAGAPLGTEIDPTAGVFNWIPTEAQGPGVYTVTVSVVDDGTPVLSDTESIRITVAEVNLAPMATNDSFTMTEDIPLLVIFPGVLENDSDPDLPANLLIAFDDELPSQGILNLAEDGSFTYTPTLNYNGLLTFTYIVSDGTLTDTAVVSLTVSPVNDAPVASDDSYTITENIPLVVTDPGVLINDSDVDGNPLNAVLDNGPVDGTIMLNADGSFIYTPTLNFNGVDTFTYHASDGEFASNEATVIIAVTPVNENPEVDAGDDQTVDEGVSVFFNGSFVDPGLLSRSLEGESIHWDFGDGAIMTGTLTPTHTYLDNGIYTITLTVSDAEGGVGSDWLLVGVENVTPTLSAIPDQTIYLGEYLSITTTFTDPGSLDTHTAIIVWGDGIIEAAIVEQSTNAISGSHIYADAGSHIASIVVTDDDGGVAISNFTVTITIAKRFIFIPYIFR